MIVLGVDPGLANIGLGVVSEEGKTPKHLHHELLRTSNEQPNAERFALIYKRVMGLLEVYKPDALAIEAQFFFKQTENAFRIGGAVGVIQLAAVQHAVPIFEYNPMHVKLSLVGTGAATKEQIIYMVRHMLALPASPESNHAADALALAITHLAARRVNQIAKLETILGASNRPPRRRSRYR